MIFRNRTHRYTRNAIAIIVVGILSVLVSTEAAFSTPSMPDLSGRWAMILVMPAAADLPFLGRVTLITETAAFVDVVQSGSLVTMFDSYCFTELEMTPALIVSSVPDAFTFSLTPYPRQAELVQSGSKIVLLQSPYTEVRGAHLEDPIHDPLPTSPYDERVYDQDEDGHPGMTIPVNALDLVSGDTYVVHRLQYCLEGTVIDENTIIGSIPAWWSEQTVISATDAILMLPYSYDRHPDESLHRFVMVRVDDTWDCARLREAMPAVLEIGT